MIHEKKQKSKTSCNCPFKVLVDDAKLINYLRTKKVRSLQLYEYTIFYEILMRVHFYKVVNFCLLAEVALFPSSNVTGAGIVKEATEKTKIYQCFPLFTMLLALGNPR